MTSAETKTEPKPVERPPLPADVTTTHTLFLAGRQLAYSANAGSITLRDESGQRKADMFFVAYTLAGHEPRHRPITFAFNGGPGAASAFLHLGALGPHRLDFGNQGDVPSAAPVLHPNEETWLDFTDLVFIDPIGTGYSRSAAGTEAVDKGYWSVSGDIDSLALFITQYLAKHGRMGSPKYLVGESYGGFRGPRLAYALAARMGVGIAGMVLMSPALDFSLIPANDLSPLPWVTRLPSMAAAALELDGPVDQAMLADTEHYAGGEYLVDLTRGRADRAAADRMAARLAPMLRLDGALIRRLGGRIDTATFQRELHRASGEVVSVYDASVRAYDPFPCVMANRLEEPLLTGILPPVTSAMIDYTNSVLGYAIDAPYVTLSFEVNEKWDFSPGTKGPLDVGAPLASMDDLRRCLALDAKLRVLIPHGLTDLITPYYASRYLVDQLPDFGDPDRVRVTTYPGGHMFYTRPASRAALRVDAERLYHPAAK